jgi:formylglycine-generating enzyme required for sulfatase activity
MRNCSAVLSVLPGPFEWCEIPSNSAFNMVTNKEAKYTFVIKPFLMAKYPITFEQFQVFVNDSQGFRKAEWWQGLAADADHCKAPGAQLNTHAQNLPRDKVSWYDAVAFCRWMSTWIGYEIRLPAEWEWQWAAQGPDGRTYPWGNKYIQGYANINEVDGKIPAGVYLNKTTPVGSFPQGASHYGVLDMSGNVWEHCLNEYDNLQNIDLSGDIDRVVRGGSSGEDQYFARCSYRLGYIPYVRSSANGFRVICGCT